jgi:hypothetical protein
MDYGRRDRRAEKAQAADSAGLGGAMGRSSRPGCVHHPRDCQNLALCDRRVKNAAAGWEWTAFRLGVGTVPRHSQRAGVGGLFRSSSTVASETVTGNARLGASHPDRCFHAPRLVRGQVSMAGFVGSPGWHAGETPWFVATNFAALAAVYLLLWIYRVRNSSSVVETEGNTADVWHE